MNWYEKRNARIKNKEAVRKQRFDDKQHRLDREDCAEAISVLAKYAMIDDANKLLGIVRNIANPTIVSNNLADYLNVASKKQLDTERKVELEFLRDKQIAITNRLKSFWKMEGKK